MILALFLTLVVVIVVALLVDLVDPNGGTAQIDRIDDDYWDDNLF